MATRSLNRLTDLGVRRAKAPGWYGDGGGLYLRIGADGAKRWVFVFHRLGKRTEMGLGSAQDVGLAEARTARDEARKQLVAGQNPVEERRRERERQAAEAAAAAPRTFAQWAEEIAPVLAPKAEKARAAWVRMLTGWVGKMKDKPPAEITTEDVLAALKPYWTTRPETGRRMRMRIEAVLDAARARGLISSPWENPARWNGHLEHLLTKRATPVRHHKALPYGEAAAFMARLREKEGMAAKALEFTVLTAARTSETIFAVWSEMDLDAKVWTVPKERMKKRREHRVPLSPAALAVLEAATPPEGGKPGAWVFPSLWRPGKPLSTAAMERVLDDLGLQGRATVHGMRSTFRDWAGDCTNFDKETIEAALAHLVGDETERAYRRGDALLKRRKLMEAWAGFLAERAGANVRPFIRPG
ncbi:tyrosine-type recombinase/integrase [Phenylobacterium sp.]|uniref:tyrosine-type recombinase/integrase n=1 Tax=Phenylobacterium sp. TaxID=1871053 RepID=UPI003941F08F